MKDAKSYHHNVYLEVSDIPILPKEILTLCIAGLCVQETSQRNEIISLITNCEARTGWPVSKLCDDLHQEWKRIDFADDRRNDGLNMPL